MPNIICRSSGIRRTRCIVYVAWQKSNISRASDSDYHVTNKNLFPISIPIRNTVLQMLKEDYAPAGAVRIPTYTENASQYLSQAQNRTT